MSRTVDLVLCGRGDALLAVALEAIRDGQRILVVMRTGDARTARQLRRALGSAVDGVRGRVAVMTNAEIVCVDGVDAVEAVLIRQLRTGRIHAVNASAFRSSTGSSESAGGPS